MERRLRYKLRKVKKHWVTVAVASVGLMSVVGAGTASADTTTTTENTDIPTTQVTAQDQASSLTTPTVDTDSNQVTDSDSSTATTVTSQDSQEALNQTPTTVDTNAEASTQEASSQTTTLDITGSKLQDSTNAWANQLRESKVVTKADAVSDFDRHNQAYSQSADSFESVDNYLTAESWYRPKEILKDGTTWTASTENDFRPMLMVWWPNTEVERQYVNYMNNVLGISKTYSVRTSAADLRVATQEIQKRIEQKITTENSTKWLREAISAFVKTQDQWNSNSENPTSYPNQDHLQGGALLFTNSDATAQANSNYRLINRNPTYQTGRQKYFKSNYDAGYELLLANDVDNSNPVVQAEQLNHFHYLMNWGDIVMGDSEANFDGVRVDAVDNVDADLLQIQRDYYKAKYGVDKNEKNAIDHLSILEAWSTNDNDYVKDQNSFALSIDNYQRSYMLSAFGYASAYRQGLANLVSAGLKNRSTSNSGDPVPNYVFIRAHDSEVQTRIATVIREQLGLGDTDGLTNITLADLEKAFEIYNKDMYSTDKRYYINNLPMAYAWMLQNKDTVTRVYYGDLFTDNGQYMATKTPFYDAIETMLKARIKYVAGGQTASYKQDWNGGILTSVRYGKGANSAADLGTSETRTSGMALLINNMPNFRASRNVTLNMGLAHRNQAYRPLLISRSNGIDTYLNDSDVSRSEYKYTDSLGRLTFSASELRSVANAQVSGYLAVWVPVGAADDQDVRTQASTSKTTDGNIYHQSDALDSQVIYEGFSNFQAFAQTPEQYTNAVIAKNADLFKSWGITQFEMAPQYVSSEDGSFLDSIVLNGYAFSDRYDLAMSKNNKYGSKEDLANAIKSLHKAGIKVLADWVPDQMYNLPGKEVVTATRVNSYGNPTSGALINKTPYVVNTRTYGDYQEQYGGKFLDELQKLYPSLFTTKQISTGKPIDPSVKITNWSAKYFNGSNILGRGAGYVLSDTSTKKYFNVSKDKFFIPTVFVSTGEDTPVKPQPDPSSTTKKGMVNDGKGYVYYLDNGKKAKATFITQGDDLYYFDKNGYRVSGMKEIRGVTYYFGEDGKALKDAVYKDKDGKSYYFAKDGQRYDDGYFLFGDKVRYFKDGVMAVGLTEVDGHVQFFDKDGFQVKGYFVRTSDGKLHYFNRRTGNQVENTFVVNTQGQWFYFDDDGIAVTGAQTINGQHLYFDDKGAQVKGDFVTDKDGRLSYYDARSGEQIRKRFVRDSKGQWFYFDKDGYAVTGSKTINGQHLYFNSNGVQVKGGFVRDSNGKLRYYDANSGELIRNRFVVDKYGQWYYFNNSGVAVTGAQTINGQRLYFDKSGIQIKGRGVWDDLGRLMYFDRYSGDQLFNGYAQPFDDYWYYFGWDGFADLSRYW